MFRSQAKVTVQQEWLQKTRVNFVDSCEPIKVAANWFSGE